MKERTNVFVFFVKITMARCTQAHHPVIISTKLMIDDQFFLIVVMWLWMYLTWLKVEIWKRSFFYDLISGFLACLFNFLSKTIITEISVILKSLIPQWFGISWEVNGNKSQHVGVLCLYFFNSIFTIV